MTAPNVNIDPGSKVKPFGMFERMVARRYISATKSGAGVSLISIIAFIGIMLAVAVLIVVMSIMESFRAQLLDQLIGFDGHVFIESQISDDVLLEYDEITASVIDTTGVISARPVIQSYSYMTSDNGETVVLVHGSRPEDIRQTDYIAGEGHLLEGTFDDFGEGRKGGNKIALAIGVANELSVRVGSAVTLITGNGAETAFGTSPTTQKTYEVGAIFTVDNSQYDKGLVYMPLEQAQLFFRRGKGVDYIDVRVKKPYQAEAYIPEIVKASGAGTFGYTWREKHSAYNGILNQERMMMRIILSLILLVAVLNIITGLVMLVKDKMSDIAVLRTIGATQGSIMRIFFLSGSMIGILGTLFGVLLGVLVTLNISTIEKGLAALLGRSIWSPEFYLFQDIPAEIQIGEIFTIVVFSLVMSFLSTVYPAWRAARLDPVEALRYE